tara:strand:- start:157 stop:414 length:258 start_codon:yes stop_codon:yes gene_type:complete
MAYVKHDKNNSAADPQPTAVTVYQFENNEGWSTLAWKNFNGDYQARNNDNSARTPGTFQARNNDNSTRTPAAYQRHDKDNNAVSA